jgi:histidine triad (HIT) family protein
MPADADCLFCKIIAGDLPGTIIDSDERTVSFMDIYPVTRGHALVVPRNHSRDLHEIGTEDLAAVARAGQRLAARARDALGPTG